MKTDPITGQNCVQCDRGLVTSEWDGPRLCVECTERPDDRMLSLKLQDSPYTNIMSCAALES